MKQIRLSEFTGASVAEGVKIKIFDYEDTMLYFLDKNILFPALLQYAREQDFSAIFSFDSEEKTWGFDHLDHLMAGLLARYLSSMADVSWHRPEFPATTDRPDLYLLNSIGQATHYLPVDEEMRQRRLEYLFRHYPSQFQRDDEAEIARIFDTINPVRDGMRIEQWLEIRRRN